MADTTTTTTTTSPPRPTSDTIAATLSSQIAHKTILITGCSPSTLGAQLALSLAPHNPKLLILAGRDPTALSSTRDAIHALAPTCLVRTLALDLSSQASVRAAAKEVESWAHQKDDEGRGIVVDVMVHSAAVMAAPYELLEGWGVVEEGEGKKGGVESQFVVNHLGGFLLTNLLLKGEMGRNSEARVVNVTSNGYALGGIRWDDISFEKEPYQKWAAYGQSKTANILFAHALAKRLGPKGILAFSAEVGGAIYTNLGRYLVQEDFDMLATIKIPVLTHAEGTATQVAAAFDPTLAESNGAFLEHTKPSQVIQEWATGDENAERLWKVSEKLVGEEFVF